MKETSQFLSERVMDLAAINKAKPRRHVARAGSDSNGSHAKEEDQRRRSEHAQTMSEGRSPFSDCDRSTSLPQSDEAESAQAGPSSSLFDISQEVEPDLPSQATAIDCDNNPSELRHSEHQAMEDKCQVAECFKHQDHFSEEYQMHDKNDKGRHLHTQDGYSHETDPDTSEEDSPPAKRMQFGKRAALPKHATQTLRLWLFSHTAHPYPTDKEKRALSKQTGLSMMQLNNWFINARRRVLAQIKFNPSSFFPRRSHSYSSSIAHHSSTDFNTFLPNRQSQFIPPYNHHQQQQQQQPRQLATSVLLPMRPVPPMHTPLLPDQMQLMPHAPILSGFSQPNDEWLYCLSSSYPPQSHLPQETTYMNPHPQPPALSVGVPIPSSRQGKDDDSFSLIDEKPKHAIPEDQPMEIPKSSHSEHHRPPQRNNRKPTGQERQLAAEAQKPNACSNRSPVSRQGDRHETFCQESQAMLTREDNKEDTHKVHQLCHHLSSSLDKVHSERGPSRSSSHSAAEAPLDLKHSSKFSQDRPAQRRSVIRHANRSRHIGGSSSQEQRSQHEQAKLSAVGEPPALIPYSERQL